MTGPNAALFQAQSLGFAYVAVEGGRLTLELIDADGQRLYRREITQ